MICATDQGKSGHSDAVIKSHIICSASAPTQLSVHICLTQLAPTLSLLFEVRKAAVQSRKQRPLIRAVECVTIAFAVGVAFDVAHGVGQATRLADDGDSTIPGCASSISKAAATGEALAAGVIFIKVADGMPAGNVSISHCKV